jgi:hypothetical protein
MQQKTLKEEAQGYTPTAKTRNISELQKVSTDVVLENDSFEFEKDGKVKKVDQKVITVEGEKYRVPVSVIASLQAILEDNPELKFFKVKRTGEGKDGTKYTVIPLQ